MGDFENEFVMQIDLWGTGQHGYVVQRPLAEALLASGGMELRMVYAQHSPDLAAMRALGLPECHTAGTANSRRVHLALPHILPVRKRLDEFYKSPRTQRIVHVTMASVWDHFYLDIAKKSGAKILLVIHDGQRHIGEESRIMEWMEHRLIRMADALAVLSPYAASVLAQRIGTSKPIYVVSPGLIMNAGPPSPAKAAPSGRPMRFLFFGRFVEYKGLDILLEAWSMFKKNENGAPATLSIIGSGKIDQHLPAIAAAKDVTLQHGWISDAEMADVFTNHDVNILPYREGSESATALAGMWAGMPAIATNIACFNGKFIHRKNALLTDIDAGEVATAIDELAGAPALYTKLADGTFHAAQGWTASAVAENWKQVYSAVWQRATGTNGE